MSSFEKSFASRSVNGENKQVPRVGNVIECFFWFFLFFLFFVFCFSFSFVSLISS